MLWKRHGEVLLKAISAVLLVIAVLTSPLALPEKKDVAREADYPLLDFCIVLDAGHGGQDGGAIGLTTGVHEADVNLAIVNRLKILFEAVGASVVLTRQNEKALCAGDFCKREDMERRASIIETARPYLVISVHCNSFPSAKSADGAQVFFYPGSQTGEQLAGDITASCKRCLGRDSVRSPKDEDFYMLRHGNSTNVMVECGFLSNPAEEKKLIAGEYQAMLAYCIFDGSCTFIRSVLQPRNI